MKRTWRAALAVIAVALLIGVLPSPAAAGSEQDLIVSIAYAHIGDKFRLGASGPTKFDCSGFVWYVFNTADLADRIGGKPLRARQFEALFRERGLLSTDWRTARVGDLVFYGNPAKHSGIVTRIDNQGKPRVTSALTIGVRETPLQHPRCAVLRVRPYGPRPRAAAVAHADTKAHRYATSDYKPEQLPEPDSVLGAHAERLAGSL